MIQSIQSIAKLPKWILWGLVFPLIVLNGWLLLLILEYFHSLITTVVAATLLSFILDYPIQTLQSWKIKRSLAVLFVLLLVIVILATLGVTLIPLIIDQLNRLVESLPTWLISSSKQLKSLETLASDHNLTINVSSIGSELLGRLSTQLQQLSGQILGSIFSAVGSIFDLIVTIVLTFYLLLHGEELWDGLFQMLPDNFARETRPALRTTFHNYFIGQVTVATVKGFAMTTAFSIVGVPFGLLFGVGVGIMAIFPFGGALSIGVVSFLVGLKSIWLGLKVLAIGIAIEQIIESAIAPRLLGEFTGLNPVLILISLLIGAKIAGFIGLILAVPLTSLIKNSIGMVQLYFASSIEVN
jgi:predicted PurR-regulated permease PerM